MSRLRILVTAACALSALSLGAYQGFAAGGGAKAKAEMAKAGAAKAPGMAEQPTDKGARTRAMLEQRANLRMLRRAISLKGPFKPPAPTAAPKGESIRMGGPNPSVNYALPNYANSPPLHKFVDSLPGLTAANANNLGQYIPIATKIPNPLFPYDDYYEIGLTEYSEKMHTDLPPTKLRGYVDLAPGAGPAHYLGPLIIAERNKAVRIKFTNGLATGTSGNLFLPTDTTFMGAGLGPNGVDSFTQNRMAIHLHGGLPAWVSDGTPHQWITPAGEVTPYTKGVSQRNVPDMPDPGAGSMTLHYPNEQSARLMFYHDHALGITRLNVYAGEAAGYLLTDPVEQGLIASGKIPGKDMGVYTYGIPLVIQDKTYVSDATTPTETNPARYTTAVDPLWDTANWGGGGSLWFPHVYMPNQDPNSMDNTSPMGRWDYGPWFWPPMDISLLKGPLPTVSAVPEAFMDTPIVNGTPYPFLQVEPRRYRFRILNACNDRNLNLQLYYADPLAPTEVRMVPAIPGLPAGWPTDGRDGGAPDPTLVGPTMIQIGNEAGFLANATPIPNQPVCYEYNRRSIVVLNVSTKALFMGPAERADVIVDFSAAPVGSSIILYNDAPAPVPAFDPRLDYYTGDFDQTASGGAPPTLAGFGPNTRTIMQFRVVAAGSLGLPADSATYPNYATTLAALQDPVGGIPAAFAASQPPPIVPQPEYGPAYGTTYPISGITGGVPWKVYSKIQDTSLTYIPFGGTTPVTTLMKPKAIQELFETNYGRMNATLGVELPFTNFNIQTTIPLGYIDPVTEIIPNGETQIWKITHNGVDTHTIHFHLVNVQVINRVGWDGQIRIPDANEIGWKESVRMHPLEDCIVAAKAVAPRLPFGVPDSIRPLDPTQATNAPITVTNPADGNQITVTNAMTNFGWEFVWHCHLLGHEENDMMRPLILQMPTALTVPADPSNLTATQPTNTQVDLAWQDNSNNETGFRIERDSGDGVWALMGFTDPNVTTFSDPNVVIGHSYGYRVRAYNGAGFSNPVEVIVGVRYVTAIATTPASGAPGQTVTLSAVLTRTIDSAAISGKTITFSIGATTIGTATTAADGSASISYVVSDSLALGANTVTVAFAGDPLYVGTSSPLTLTVGPADTSIAPTAASGAPGQTISLSATLTRVTDGAPLAGKTLTFSIGATVIGSGVTAADGTATISYKVLDTLAPGANTVTVAFAAQPLYNASSGNLTLTVVPASTTVTVNNPTGSQGVQVTFTSNLTRTTDNAPLAGQTIGYTVDGTSIGTATTDAAGNASLNYTVPIPFSAGTHPVVASFAGAPLYASSTANGTLTVNKCATRTWTAAVSGGQGQLVTLSAYVIRRVNGADAGGLAGKTVSFTIDGGAVGSAVTDGTGYATLNYTIPGSMSVGTHTIGAAFAGDADYLASSGTASLTVVVLQNVRLPFTNVAGTVYQTVTLSAYLTTMAGTPIVGRTITFAVNGTVVGSGVTDTTGRAVYAYKIPATLAVGSYPMTATFAGDSTYQAKTTTATLTVQAGDNTAMWTASRTGTRGTAVTLYAYLWRLSDGAMLNGQTITFRIDGAIVGTAVTNSTGYAAISYTIPLGMAVGNHTIRAEFAGNPPYNASFATATLTVN